MVAFPRGCRLKNDNRFSTVHILRKKLSKNIKYSVDHSWLCNPVQRHSFIKSFHLYLLSGKSPTFSFYKAPEKLGGSKDFCLYSHNFCDIIIFRWSRSYIHMIFYSITDSFQRDRTQFRKHLRKKLGFWVLVRNIMSGWMGLETKHLRINAHSLVVSVQ